jgi:hypothetical protein
MIPANPREPSGLLIQHAHLAVSVAQIDTDARSERVLVFLPPGLKRRPPVAVVLFCSRSPFLHP